MEKDEILSRWSEYIGELYNDDNRGDMPDIVAEVESPITRREVEHALRGMPEKKSPGPDGITTEMRLAAGEVGILELIELSNMIHNQGSFLSEHNKSIFITLPKVNGTIKCEKHRTISLMSPSPHYNHRQTYMTQTRHSPTYSTKQERNTFQ